MRSRPAHLAGDVSFARAAVEQVARAATAYVAAALTIASVIAAALAAAAGSLATVTHGRLWCTTGTMGLDRLRKVEAT